LTYKDFDTLVFLEPDQGLALLLLCHATEKVEERDALFLENPAENLSRPQKLREDYERVSGAVTTTKSRSHSTQDFGVFLLHLPP